MNAHDEITLGKICRYASQTIEFVKGMDLPTFSKDAKTVSACVFNLSQIGELAYKLSDEFVSKSTIPWHKIRGLRNRIVHDYEGIQLNIIWDVIESYLPTLVSSINEVR